MTSKRKKVQSKSTRNAPRAEASRSAAETVVESPFVPHSPSPILSTPILKVVLIAAAIFVAAHLALMIGLTAPDKITFDEVHYVPAAKQMLETGEHGPLLNPMHPPLAKQFMAWSIRTFGDGPFGWRYPSVVFGSLAIVAMYLCGLVLFAYPSAPYHSPLDAMFFMCVGGFLASIVAVLVRRAEASLEGRGGPRPRAPRSGRRDAYDLKRQ